MKKILFLLVFCVLSGLAFGQAANEPERLFAIDLKHRRIEVGSYVCLREGALEFLLCGRGTKEHESILVTDVPASQIHAGLLTIGLTAGQSGEWMPKGGKFIPPRGGELEITLEWLEDGGQKKSVPAGTWLKAEDSLNKTHPDKWVFVGSRLLSDGFYMADEGGEIISLANFDTAVIDVPFESSSDNTMLDFQADGGIIPPVGTKVHVIIKAVKGAENTPYARAVIDIDRFGHYLLDASDIPFGSIRKLMKEFVRKHPQAMVVIRPEPFAIVYDVERVRQELILAGITRIREERPALNAKLLPRTAQEVEEYLNEFATALKAKENLLDDPAQNIRATLRLIRIELNNIGQNRSLLTDYAAKLERLLEEKPQKHDSNN